MRRSGRYYIGKTSIGLVVSILTTCVQKATFRFDLENQLSTWRDLKNRFLDPARNDTGLGLEGGNIAVAYNIDFGSEL